MKKDTFLNRTTLFVSSLEKSLNFYKSLFNLCPYKDIKIDLSKVPFFPVPDQYKNSNAGFSILKGDNYSGMLGLLEVEGFSNNGHKHDIDIIGVGSTALVFETDNAEESVNKIEDYGGRVVMPISEGRNIGDREGNFVPVKMYMAYDPDGYFLEVFERI